MRYYFVNHAPCKSEYKKNNCEEITKEQYDSFVKAINSFNLFAPEGKYYRLEIDGTWKLYELPICADSHTPSESEYAEAGKILMGVTE